MTTKQALLLSASLLILGFYHQNNAQSDKPRYQNIPGMEYTDTPTRKIPVFVITIPQQHLYKMFDTSNAIMSYHGMELGKTTSRKHESLMANQWDRLLEYAKPDTIKVKGGKP